MNVSSMLLEYFAIVSIQLNTSNIHVYTLHVSILYGILTN